MNTDDAITTASASPPLTPPFSEPGPSAIPPMPRIWRLLILLGISLLLLFAYVLGPVIGPRGQALFGVFFFFGLVAAFSSNLRAVNWRTIGWGVALQVLLAILVLKVAAFQRGVNATANVVKSFIGFSDKGAKFVFGNLADSRPPDFTIDGKETNASGTWSRLFGFKAVDRQTGQEVEVKGYLFQFAFIALPPILFISAFFTVLYHYGVLQWLVGQLAKVMRYFMRTSGAETLSVSANVFMGQTEAPLIVKPYVPRMTGSELFTLMVSGFAHISGALMVVYISYGADPVAVLTTCVMACPCSLYLAKLFLPETGTPETAGSAGRMTGKSPYVNAIDAAASGTGDGLRLALNVGAMLIVFIAFVALFDALLGGIKPSLISLGFSESSLSWLPNDLSLEKVFGWLFSPAAYLTGVESVDADKVGSLLGSKLAINEHYAYLEMKKLMLTDEALNKRSAQLAAFALTGFANFASVGIQIGGIGAMAPERRHDLARLGGRALFVGFVATLLNAAIAGVLL